MKTIYWTSTSVIALFLILSAYSYFFSKSNIEGLRELGFPDFFRIQLAVLKVIAVIALLWSGIPFVLKEWAYAGVGFFLITAMVAHIAHQDSIMILLLLVVLMAALILSRYSLHIISSQ